MTTTKTKTITPKGWTESITISNAKVNGRSHNLDLIAGYLQRGSVVITYVSRNGFALGKLFGTAEVEFNYQAA